MTITARIAVLAAHARVDAAVVISEQEADGPVTYTVLVGGARRVMDAAEFATFRRTNPIRSWRHYRRETPEDNP